MIEQVLQGIHSPGKALISGRNIFVKDPEPLRRDSTYRYKHTLQDMLRAIEDITERSNRQLPPTTANFKGIVGKEPYPVSRKAGEVLRRLLMRGVEKLKSLFSGSRSRSEVVATFIAILDLLKNGSAVLEDNDTSGDNPDVKLIKNPEEEGNNGTD